MGFPTVATGRDHRSPAASYAVNPASNIVLDSNYLGGILLLSVSKALGDVGKFFAIIYIKPYP